MLPIPVMSHEARAEAATYFVRSVPGGFAVFRGDGEKLSEVYDDREVAIAEARSYGGLVLVESETGHIVSEVI